MLKKPESFDEIVGHKNLVSFLKEHIEKGTLPQFIIFEGDEGLGKTSLAKIVAVELLGRDPLTVRRVIQENRSTESVLLYNMSVNGGKDTAKDVEANLSLGISGLNQRVIIMDEAHGMSEAAQDVFLVSTEFLAKGVYLFMCTTDSMNLKATLKSRALTLHLNHLSMKEMKDLLTACVRERKLRLQAEASTLSMLAAWADGKPRIALNLLEGFSPNSAVSADTIKEFIDYLSVDDVLPLLACLHGSMSMGLSYITEVKLNASFIPVLVEILKVKSGSVTYKLSLTDVHKVREQLSSVSVETLTKFIYLAAGHSPLTRPQLISAFLQAHVDSAVLSNPMPKNEVFEAELQQKREIPNTELPTQEHAVAPTLDKLLLEGVVFG